MSYPTFKLPEGSILNPLAGDGPFTETVPLRSIEPPRSMTMRIQTSYLTCVLEPSKLTDTLSKAMGLLGPLEFDSIACRGVSGILFAPVLAHLMHKTVTVVRKNTEGTHSNHTVEGNISPDLRYVIVDDCTSTCTTIETIYRDVRKAVPSARCVAIYLYYYNEIYPNYFSDIPGMSRIGNNGIEQVRSIPWDWKAEKPL